jgi:GDP-mannose mannosyl hydrolase
VCVPFEEYRRFLSTMPIVCVDCLVVNDRGEFLLVKRENEPLMGEYWMPGGRVHKGERLVEAAQRKMREEIGVDVDIVENVGFFEFFYEKTKEKAEGGVHSISFVYLVKPKRRDIRLDSQSSAWGWFKEIPAQLRKYNTIHCPTTNLPSKETTWPRH